MKTVKVQTTWAGSGTKTDPWRPKVADTYSFINWQDISGVTHATPTFTLTGNMQDTDYLLLMADPAYNTKTTLLGSK